MTLHTAIEKLLNKQSHPLTAREIADKLNKNKWYVKRDQSHIEQNQIIARVRSHDELFNIDSSISPLRIGLLPKKRKYRTKNIPAEIETKKSGESRSKTIESYFSPISNSNTSILILGSYPGEKSLSTKEYYANSRNRFWEIISEITGNSLPLTYSEKKQLLLDTKIGVWDVASDVIRKGSLDSNIKAVKPNNLNDFIARHKNLKIVGFRACLKTMQTDYQGFGVMAIDQIERISGYATYLI